MRSVSRISTLCLLIPSSLTAPATSPKPPDIDPDELDPDEMDASDTEDFAQTGHTPIRLNLSKHAQPRQRYTPPVPKRRPYAHAYMPVVVEDDDEDEGWDPDEHVSYYFVET
jgi:hypothetical protein